MPFWALAAAFLLVESVVVHIQFRRESESFSLFEVPLVLGLLFATPFTLLFSMILGTGLALRFVRHQTPLKLAFNVANLAFYTVTMAAIVHLHVVDDVLEPRGWATVAVLVAVGAMINVGAISVVITLTEGRVERSQLRLWFEFGLLVSAANASLGLLASLIYERQPLALLLLLGPLAVVFASYRGFASERTRRQKVEFLYESAQALQEDKVHAAINTLLAQARQMFRAESAEVVLLPALATGVETESVTIMGHRSDGPLLETVEGATGAFIRDVSEHIERPAVVDPNGADLTSQYLTERHMGAAMVAGLEGEHRPIGILVIGDRMGGVFSFTDEDLRLFGMLAHNMATALENDRLENALGRLQELEGRLSHQATHDALTGLANRALFLEELEKAQQRTEKGVAVAFLDLDDFKLVNDSMGHVAGDALLAAVARRIRARLRPSDLAARLGGDEFAVLVHNVDEVQKVAERVLTAVSEPFDILGQTIRVQCSIGVAIADGTERAVDLLRNADVAMYAAKETGKGRLTTFSPELHEQVVSRQTLRSELRHAIEHDEFRIAYQPIVDLGTNEIAGFEALLRWQSSNHGMRMPSDFIAEAEVSGLILPIERWLVAQAACDLRQLRRSLGHGDLFMTVNLSARHVNEPGIDEVVLGILRDNDIEPGGIVVELTETVMLDRSDALLGSLLALREAGVRLAFDDFGTGYSSLQYLRQFPVDILKMAQPFVEDIDDGATGTALGEAILMVAAALDLHVVAEGIEQPGQAARLRAASCRYGQGFLFARPAPIGEIEATYGSSLEVASTGEPRELTAI